MTSRPSCFISYSHQGADFDTIAAFETALDEASKKSIDVYVDNRLAIGDRISDHEDLIANVSGAIILLTPFLKSSLKLARLDQRHPNLMAENREGIDVTRRNTAALWGQLTELGNLRLALHAYRAVQAWRPGLQETNWERLGDALHPLNASAIARMAAAGQFDGRRSFTFDRTVRIRRT